MLVQLNDPDTGKVEAAWLFQFLLGAIKAFLKVISIPDIVQLICR